MVEEMTALQQKQLLVLTKTLNSLRNNDVLSDVILVCGEQKFPANRLILAASSSFFMDIFGGTVFPITKKEFPLQKIPPNIMKNLLNFMYTGMVDIDETDISDIKSICAAACDLQLNVLVEHCCKLVMELSPTQAVKLEFLRMIRNLSSSSVKSCVAVNFGENSFKLHESPDIFKLTFNEFTEILSFCENDINSSADEILQAVVKWLDHDVPNRQQHALALLNYVEKDDLSDEILEEVQKMAVFPTCPALMMFVLGILMPRHQRLKMGLRSMHNSHSSLASGISDDDNCQNTGAKPKRCLLGSSEKPVPSRIEDHGPITKGRTSVHVAKFVADNGPDQPKDVGSTNQVVLGCQSDQMMKALQSSRKKTENDVEGARKELHCELISAKNKNSVITPTVKERFILSDTHEVGDSCHVGATMLLTENSCHHNFKHHVTPDSVTSMTVFEKTTKGKEVCTKPERTVADLSILKLRGRQHRTILTESNVETVPSSNKAQENLANSTKHDATSKQITVGSSRKTSAGDLYSSLDEAIRKHDESRNQQLKHIGHKTRNDEFCSRSATRNKDPSNKLSYISNSDGSHSVKMDDNRNRYVNNKHFRGSNRSCSLDRSSSSGRYGNHTIKCDENKTRSPAPQNRQNMDSERDMQHEKTHNNTLKSSALVEAPYQPSHSRNRIVIQTENGDKSYIVLYFVLGKDDCEWMLQIFDPVSRKLDNPLPIKTELCQRSALVSCGHTIYFIGGVTDPWEVTKTVLAYDSRANTWQRMSDLKVARWHAGAAELDSSIYVVGGVGEDNTRLRSVERYDSAVNKWTQIAPLISCRESPSVSAIHPLLFVVGGYVLFPEENEETKFEQGQNATAELYNPVADQWTELTTSFAVGRDLPEKSFCTSVLQNELFAIRRHGFSIDSNTVQNPLLYELTIFSGPISCHTHTIHNPELMDIIRIFSADDKQLCLITKRGSVYLVSWKSTGVIADPQMCYQGNMNDLVYAVNAFK